jgi:hypothetical protein
MFNHWITTHVPNITHRHKIDANWFTTLKFIFAKLFFQVSIKSLRKFNHSLDNMYAVWTFEFGSSKLALQ